MNGSGKEKESDNGYDFILYFKRLLRIYYCLEFHKEQKMARRTSLYNHYHPIYSAHTAS
jgi:hypothetical protein